MQPFAVRYSKIYLQYQIKPLLFALFHENLLEEMIDKHHAVMHSVVNCDYIPTEQSDSEILPHIAVADKTSEFFGIILA